MDEGPGVSGDTIIKGTRAWPSFVLLMSAGGLGNMVFGPAWELLPPVVVGATIAIQTASLLWAGAIIAKPNKLTIGDEGFSIEPSLAVRRAIAWSDVEAVPARCPARTAWLSWRPREGAVLPRYLVRPNGEACFAGGWTVSVEEIQRLMNDRLNKARQ
jgi:hypothetical protein